METQTTTEEITFSLRIPCELNEKITTDAERRSRQAHIVYLLEKFFETPPNGNGSTPKPHLIMQAAKKEKLK